MSDVDTTERVRPPPPEVWRLYHGERPVGFAKRFGSSLMWSKTAAAYSGTRIPHTVQLRALPLRTLSGTPLFHGDVISPPGDEDRYLVIGVGEEILFARAGSGSFVEREGSPFPKRRDFVRHGSILESVHLSRPFDAALRAYAAREFRSSGLSWSLSSAIFLGCVLSGALQWSLFGGVGPIRAGIGGLLGGWGYFLGWKRLFPESFRRSTTSRVAGGAVWRTAWLFSALYGVSGALGLPGVASSMGGIVAGMFAASVFGGGFGAVAGVLAADTLTRREDEQLGYSSESRTFLDIPSPLIRFPAPMLEEATALPIAPPSTAASATSPGGRGGVR